jgi:hypothetical protein
VGVIVNGAAGGFTVMGIGWVLAEFPVSSVTVKVYEPHGVLLQPVGVPAITPELETKTNPGGSVVGETLQVYGLVPPDSVKTWL